MGWSWGKKMISGNPHWRVCVCLLGRILPKPWTFRLFQHGVKMQFIWLVHSVVFAAHVFKSLCKGNSHQCGRQLMGCKRWQLLVLPSSPLANIVGKLSTMFEDNTLTMYSGRGGRSQIMVHLPTLSFTVARWHRFKYRWCKNPCETL